MLALYDHPISSNALKVRFLLAELGLEYERREVPMARPRPQWYVDVNPLAGIPTLVDGDLVLAESNAILRYLADRGSRRRPVPGGPAAARAASSMLLDRYSLTIRPAFFRWRAGAGVHAAGRVRRRRRRSRGRPREGAGGRAHAAHCSTSWSIQRLLRWGRSRSPTVAAAPVLFRTTKTGMDLAPYPNLRTMARHCAAPGRRSPAPGPVT